MLTHNSFFRIPKMLIGPKRPGTPDLGTELREMAIPEAVINGNALYACTTEHFKSRLWLEVVIGQDPVCPNNTQSRIVKGNVIV